MLLAISHRSSAPLIACCTIRNAVRILPVLIYVTEALKLTKKLKNKLGIVQQSMERKRISEHLRGRKTPVSIKEQTAVADILVKIKSKKRLRKDM